MTATDFNDVQVHRAAADLHHFLTTGTGPVKIDEFLRAHPAWEIHEIEDARQTDFREQVALLVDQAADVSQWAVELGALALTPYHAHAWRTNEGVDVAVQIAAGAAMKPAFRNEIAHAVQVAVEDVYAKFLGRVPRAHVPAATR